MGMRTLRTLFCAVLVLAACSASTLNCTDGRTCVYMSGCNGNNGNFDQGCPLAYSYKLEGQTLIMELAGYQPSAAGRYLAIGFNEEKTMSNARVTECSAIGPEQVPSVKLSWNKDPGTVNVRIDGEQDFRDQIISEAVSKYENGMVYCSWKQNVGPFDNDKVFQIVPGVSYYHLVAYGNTKSNPDGLTKHEHAEFILYTDFGTSGGEPPAKQLDCENGRTCVYMKSCSGVFNTKCHLAYSFKLDGDILTMELAGYQPSGTNRYLAVGFGEKEGMAESKVTECSAIGGETIPTVKLSYNTPGDESVNSRIDNEPSFRNSIISDDVSMYTDGMIYCSWKQNVSGNGNDKVFQWKPSTLYYHICAHGPTDADGLDEHDEHDAPLVTDFGPFDTPTDAPVTATDNYCNCAIVDGWFDNDWDPLGIWVDVVIILDTSQSMGRSLEEAKSVITSFIGLMSTDTSAEFYSRIGVIAVSDTVQVIYNLNMSSSDDLSQVQQHKIDKIDVGSAFQAALKMFADGEKSSSYRENAKQIIYYLTNSAPGANMNGVDDFKTGGGIIIVNDYILEGETADPGLQKLASDNFFFTDLSENYVNSLGVFCEANCFCAPDLHAFNDDENSPRTQANRGCFHPVNNGIPQQKARDTCKAEGAALVSIHDSQKEFFVNGVVSIFGPKKKFWLGLQNNGTEWIWDDKSTSPFADWDTANGQPNTNGGKNLCAYAQQATGFNTPWTAANCAMGGVIYVCESAPCSTGNNKC